MARKNKIKATGLEVALKVINYVLLFLVALSMLYPFWEILVKSFMTDEDHHIHHLCNLAEKLAVQGLRGHLHRRNLQYRQGLSQLDIRDVHRYRVSAGGYHHGGLRAGEKDAAGEKALLFLLHGNDVFRGRTHSVLYRDPLAQPAQQDMGAHHPVFHKRVQRAGHEGLFPGASRRAGGGGPR